MSDPRGFLTVPREVVPRRPAEERVLDWREPYAGTPGQALLPIIAQQAGRCMDCGVPFCHAGCPLGNLIPELNDLIWRDDWVEAVDRLHATNNFPEFTGRLCSPPCESACVLGVGGDPVTIQNVEVAIVDRAWADRRVSPVVSEWQTDATVAVVGSGPAGLALAQQLTRAGHTVVVFERSDAVGGLLRYGIPDFKLEKSVLDRRLKQMRLEGTLFRTDVNVGVDVTGQELLERFDAVVLAIGSAKSRRIEVPGYDLGGIHQAVKYLIQANMAVAGKAVPNQVDAAGKNVVIIGGGRVGEACLGTALRQGAASVTMLDAGPLETGERPADKPWPMQLVGSFASPFDEEGGTHLYGVSPTRLVGKDGQVSSVEAVDMQVVDGESQPVAGSERSVPADLVLLALGSVGPQTDGLLDELGIELGDNGHIARDDAYRTNVRRVFCCGDAGRGLSQVVWAIAEGRACAASVDAWLQGSSQLPHTVKPADGPLAV